jgi:hypothetical protein
MAQVARVIEKPTHVTVDDGMTYRAVVVRLANGHRATAYIHDSPGDWLTYKVGDRVRLSINRAGNEPESDDTRAGLSVLGKFGDDFEPVGEDNREVHGPKDGNVVIRSRNDIDIDAAGTVHLGKGGGSGDPIAINNESLGDAEALYDYMSPNPGSPIGDFLVKLNALLSGALTDDILKLVTAHELAKPSAQGAENVTANAAEAI